MAITQILPVGTTEVNSADVVVEAGSELTVALKDAAGPTIIEGAKVYILLKDDAGEYFRIDSLSADRPALVLTAAGTYRFTRRAGVSCGVFSG